MRPSVRRAFVSNRATGACSELVELGPLVLVRLVVTIVVIKLDNRVQKKKNLLFQALFLVKLYIPG